MGKDEEKKEKRGGIKKFFSKIIKRGKRSADEKDESSSKNNQSEQRATASQAQSKQSPPQIDVRQTEVSIAVELSPTSSKNKADSKEVFKEVQPTNSPGYVLPVPVSPSKTTHAGASKLSKPRTPNSDIQIPVKDITDGASKVNSPKLSFYKSEIPVLKSKVKTTNTEISTTKPVNVTFSKSVKLLGPKQQQTEKPVTNSDRGQKPPGNNGDLKPRDEKVTSILKSNLRSQDLSVNKENKQTNQSAPNRIASPQAPTNPRLSNISHKTDSLLQSAGTSKINTPKSVSPVDVIPRKKRRPRSGADSESEGRAKSENSVKPLNYLQQLLADPKRNSSSSLESQTNSPPPWKKSLFSKSTSSFQETSGNSNDNSPLLSSRSTHNFDTGNSISGCHPNLAMRQLNVSSTLMRPATNTGRSSSNVKDSQPKVVHYHLTIQNCDGLNIHMNNSDDGLPTNKTVRGKELPWHENSPLLSSLRRDKLALHDKLVGNYSDQESETESMKPLNLDDTVSDMTVDTMALVEMDAWALSDFDEAPSPNSILNNANKRLQFNTQPSQSHNARGSTHSFTRNMELRLSSRTPFPVKQTFNPPWRRSGQGDMSSKGPGQCTNATSTSTPAVGAIPQRIAVPNTTMSCRNPISPVSTATNDRKPVHNISSAQVKGNAPHVGAPSKTNATQQCIQQAKVQPQQTTSSRSGASNRSASVQASNPPTETTGTQYPSLQRNGKKVPTTESTGTQYPSLQRGKANRSSFHVLPSASKKGKPVAKVAPQTRTSTPTTDNEAPNPRRRNITPTTTQQQNSVSRSNGSINADMDAMLVQYLLDHPPGNYSDDSDDDTMSVSDMSISSNDENFTLTDDEEETSLGHFSRFGLSSTIEPTLRRRTRGRAQPTLGDDDVVAMTLEERVASIRDEIVRVPGVLMMSTRRQHMVVYLSHDRPNVDGVAACMRAHGVPPGEYECEVLPWRNRPGTAAAAARLTAASAAAAVAT